MNKEDFIKMIEQISMDFIIKFNITYDTPDGDYVLSLSDARKIEDYLDKKES